MPVEGNEPFTPSMISVKTLSFAVSFILMPSEVSIASVKPLSASSFKSASASVGNAASVGPTGSIGSISP